MDDNTNGRNGHTFNGTNGSRVNPHQLEKNGLRVCWLHGFGEPSENPPLQEWCLQAGHQLVPIARRDTTLEFPRFIDEAAQTIGDQPEQDTLIVAASFGSFVAICATLRLAAEQRAGNIKGIVCFAPILDLAAKKWAGLNLFKKALFRLGAWSTDYAYGDPMVITYPKFQQYDAHALFNRMHGQAHTPPDFSALSAQLLIVAGTDDHFDPKDNGRFQDSDSARLGYHWQGNVRLVLLDRVDHYGNHPDLKEGSVFNVKSDKTVQANIFHKNGGLLDLSHQTFVSTREEFNKFVCSCRSSR